MGCVTLYIEAMCVCESSAWLQRGGQTDAEPADALTMSDLSFLLSLVERTPKSV
jgi:hypothetical protein